VATEVEAQLVVIGSHGKRGLLEIAVGDTARHLSTHAPCTVLMVAPKKQRDRGRATADRVAAATRSTPARRRRLVGAAIPDSSPASTRCPVVIT
jgi:hypothetical protein